MATSSESSDSARVEVILQQWFEQQADGEAPDLAALCTDAPHLLPRVREMLARYDAMLGGGPAPATPSRSPLLVDRLGEYELKSRIGSGGMGDVFLARQASLDRMVAIKVLRREFADDPLRRLRFKREAQLTAALDHPNIVPIYGTGEDQGYVYLVMKHLAGATLDRVAVEWTPKRAAAVGAQVARALHAAHEVGIVHRDIKPGNVQLDGDDAYVLDFGLARGRVDMTLTTEGQAPGTLAYMPPEQLRGDATAIDPRGDIYSLGATIYQCLAGRPPFADDTPELLVRRALVHDPEPLQLGAADRDLETIVLRALEKDPMRRFATAMEFAEDLERYLAGQPIQSRPPSAITRAVKLARRHRVKCAVGATALLVSVVLGTQLWRSAAERTAEVERQLGLVTDSLLEARPARALQRLNELRANTEAASSRRFAELESIASSAIAREALLDRVQLDSLYQHQLLDNEMEHALGRFHPTIRAEPLTKVAFAFAAHRSNDFGTARTRLLELKVSGEFPRLAAAFLALVDDKDPVLALNDGGIPTTSSVEDHVFAAALLRIADASTDAIDPEINAALSVDPDHPRARMMLAVQHVLHQDMQRAGEVLTLQVRDDVPRPEMHCMIARLALIDRDYAKSERHLARAQRDLERTGRSQILRLAVGWIVLATERGDLDHAAELLVEARTRFGDDEWLDLSEARLCIGRGKLGASRALLTRVIEQARIPWNRRRATATLLNIDVYEYLDAVDRGQLSRPRADALIEAANALEAGAEQAGDRTALATACMQRFQVEVSLRDDALVHQRPAEARQWEDRFVQSLVTTLATHDLHPEATCQMAQHMVNRLIGRGNAPKDELELGALTQKARRRATELTRRAWRRQKPFRRQFDTAVFAAYLAAAVGDHEDATEAGAIAHHLASRFDDEDRASNADQLSRLEGILLDLGLKAWPPPP